VNQLDAFKQIEAIQPTNATTNSSPILKAAQKREYRSLLVDAVAEFCGRAVTQELGVRESKVFDVSLQKLVPLQMFWGNP
jgi:hypothetical protein